MAHAASLESTGRTLSNKMDSSFGNGTFESWTKLAVSRLPRADNLLGLFITTGV